MSKRIWGAAILSVICLAAVTLSGSLTGCDLRGASAEVVSTAVPESARTITVVGQGKAHSPPDVARLNAGVEVTAATVQEATQEAAERMTAILAALEELGIADEDIQTSNYSIYFERDYGPEIGAIGEEGAPEGRYRVSNMVEVKVRDLGRVGTVLDQVVQAGANSIWGVSFAVEDTGALEKEARAKAVEDARARAQDLAVLSGVELGEVVSVSEVIGGPSLGGYAFQVERPVEVGGVGPVSPGEVEFSVQIQVTYGIQ